MKELQIEFGREEWQSHLGGSFHGPEYQGDLMWNWIGEGEAWCVLPQGGYSCSRWLVTLDAAPLAPYKSELWDFQLFHKRRSVYRRVLPVTSDNFEGQLVLPPDVANAAKNSQQGLRLSFHKLGPPKLEVRTNLKIITTLTYELKPELQPMQFELDARASEETTVLYFRPNFAVSGASLEGTREQRKLSFRLFRLHFHRLDYPSDSPS